MLPVDTFRARIANGTAAFTFRTICGILVGLAATIAASPVSAQVTARTLIGKAVSDGASDQEVGNAINRFRDRDIDGCRAMLERVKSNDPKLPPPGVMMAMLWLSVNQLQPARAELEDTAVKFPADPEAFLMLGDLAFQERRSRMPKRSSRVPST